MPVGLPPIDTSMDRFKDWLKFGAWGRWFLIGAAQSQGLRGTGVGGSDGEALGASSDHALQETDLDEPGDKAWQRVLDRDSGGRH